MTTQDEQAGDLALLNDAIAKARAEFPAIQRSRKVMVRTKSGGSYEFTYAPLDTILACITPALASHGISLTQDIRDGKVWTILSMGLAEKALAPVPTGIKDGMGPQEVGSCLTYAQRYSLKVALVLATEEDDDGNTAAGAAWTAQDRPMARRAPDDSLEVAARVLRASTTLPGLATVWESLSKEERHALADVKDEVKTKLAKAEGERIAAQLEQPAEQPAAQEGE